jgi:hypothetical protein
LFIFCCFWVSEISVIIVSVFWDTGLGVGIRKVMGLYYIHLMVIGGSIRTSGVLFSESFYRLCVGECVAI